MKFLNQFFSALCAVVLTFAIAFGISSPSYASPSAQTADECRVLQTSLQTLVKAADFKNADQMGEILTTSLRDLEKAQLSNPVLQSVRSGYVEAITKLAQLVKEIGAEHPDHQPLKSQFFKPSFTAFSQEISPWIQKAVAECPSK
jgi:hypothetical protein